MTVLPQQAEILEQYVAEAEEALAAGDVFVEDASEEIVADFVEDTSSVDAALKFVSLKGQVGPWDERHGTAKKTLPPTAHYRGPTGNVSKGGSPVAELVGSARYHASMDWGGGARASGLQYHSAVWDDIVYLCRNPLAILWHAANQYYNAGSHGCQFPIGGTEITTTRTRQTAKAWYDEINKTWGTRGLKGHKEVSTLGTACPGRSFDDFVVPYRNGSSFGSPAPSKPTPPPAPSPSPQKTLYRVTAGGKQQSAFSRKEGALETAGKLLNDFNEVKIKKGT